MLTVSKSATILYYFVVHVLGACVPSNWAIQARQEAKASMRQDIYQPCKNDEAKVWKELEGSQGEDLFLSLLLT